MQQACVYREVRTQNKYQKRPSTREIMAPEDADQLAVIPISVIEEDLIHEAGEEMSAERRGGVQYKHVH